MMKHIFFISIILFSITAEAQYNSQYNRRQSMQPRQPRAAQQPRAPKIDVEKAVGAKMDVEDQNDEDSDDDDDNLFNIPGFITIG